jgi:hypothetical protein
VEGRTWRPLLAAAVASGLALGLAAYFWLPGLFELRFTSPVWPLDIRFSPRTELLDFAFGPAQVRMGQVHATYPRETIGLAATAALIFAGVALAFRLPLSRGQRLQLAFALMSAAVLLGLIVIPFRERIWGSVPVLQRAQYGARLILPVALLAAFAAGSVPQWPRWGTAIAGCLFAVALVYGLAYAWPAATEHADDAYFQRHWQRMLGTADGGSPVMPRWAGRGVYEPATAIASVAGAGDILAAQKRSTQIDVTVRADEDTSVQFATLYFPGWEVEVDGRPAAFGLAEGDGTIVVPVSRGDHTIALRFRDTPVRRIGNTITAVSAMGLIGALLIMAGRAVRTSRGRFPSRLPG